MSFERHLIEDFRLVLLRLLVEAGGHANESVLLRGAHMLGHRRFGRPDVRRELRWLKAEAGCVSLSDYADKVTVAELTDTGREVAAGRQTVPGIKPPDRLG